MKKGFVNFFDQEPGFLSLDENYTFHSLKTGDKLILKDGREGLLECREGGWRVKTETEEVPIRQGDKVFFS